MANHENGKKALTHYKVLSVEENTTLVELTPVTGRSHQLRVHMLSLGHPILGDRLYAHDQALALSARLQLHAQAIEFKHPITKTALKFEATCTFA